tara:strand:- start:1414 stop:1698 length:285 start_codon:yes stop_codon:yes gene_type:complete
MGNKMYNRIPDRPSPEELERTRVVKVILKKLDKNKDELKCILFLIESQDRETLLELKRELGCRLTYRSGRVLVRYCGGLKKVNMLLGGMGVSPG